MDTNAQINRLRNKKGFALIWFVLIIPVVLLFTMMAVDFSYMYVAKGQLQNAADASALAGVAALAKVPADTTGARTQAIAFAAANTVAKKPVTLASDGSNNLSAVNDITLGNWNGTNYTANGTPFNAVQTVARRTADAPDGQVDTFFTKAIGWSKMSAAASAVAAVLPGSDGFFTICGANQGPCTPDPDPAKQPTLVSSVTPSTPLILVKGKDDPQHNFAWTSLLEKATSSSQVSAYLCGQQPYSRTCGLPIYTTLGADTNTLRDLEGAMYNATYDSGNKDYYDLAKTQVTGWWLIVPITDTCPAGLSGTSWDPKPASAYAKVHIVSVCASGGGTPCYNGFNPDKKCTKGTIIIDQISCVDCANYYKMIGLKGSLVK